VVVTPDGSRAVSTSHDHTLRVWDLETGPVGALNSEYRDDAVTLVEDAKLFGTADFRSVRAWTQQRKRYLAGVDFALGFRAPDCASSDALGVEPSVEALLRPIRLPTLG
jgi:hypothetical protein